MARTIEQRRNMIGIWAKYKEDGPLVAYIYQNSGKIYVRVFTNNRQNHPASHAVVNSMDSADDYIAHHFMIGRQENARSSAARQERTESRKSETIPSGRPAAIGDIFVNTWGYDQTNVDFYQVISVTAKTVTIRQISSEIVSEEHFMSKTVVPRKDAFMESEPPMRKLVAYYGGKPQIGIDHGHTELWDGKPEKSTHYA